MKKTLTPQIKASINESVLCWLATSSKDNEPNVSPKEVFDWINDHQIIIANIASPASAKNILDNPRVCVSFVHVFKQKGFQLKGEAKYLPSEHKDFATFAEYIDKTVSEKYPMRGIFLITVQSAKEILAPSYLLYPEVTEEMQVESAKKSYLD